MFEFVLHQCAVCSVLCGSEGDDLWWQSDWAQTSELHQYIILIENTNTEHRAAKLTCYMHTHPCRKKEWERREVGGSFLLQLIFLKYFIWILAAVVLQKTKGNEPCVSEPKTTYSVRKSWCSCCSQHSEKQSQSKLLKTARGYVKHKGRKMSWWNDIWVVAGDRLASHTAKQVKYKTQVVLILHDSKLVFWGGDLGVVKFSTQTIRQNFYVYSVYLISVSVLLFQAFFGSAISGQRSKHSLKWNPHSVSKSQEISWETERRMGWYTEVGGGEEESRVGWGGGVLL